jgi:diaminopimelate epimerase
MVIHFFKYHGTGNDFILIDGRDAEFTGLSNQAINKLCHRRFGIGADGLMVLKPVQDFDFSMEYYNSDGFPGSMCGNGGRCIVSFAKRLGIVDEFVHFIATDGPHTAFIDPDGRVKLKMQDVPEIVMEKEYDFLNTGSPHFVKFVDNPDLIDIVNEGKKIRHSSLFQPLGTNVNFVSRFEKGIYVRTYERGVEDETYSCGTGSVASAISFYIRNRDAGTTIPVKTLGGELKVSFEETSHLSFQNIFLEGPAQFVYSGLAEI